MEILKKEEKITMVLSFDESDEIYEEYVVKKGYQVLEELVLGGNKLEVTLYKLN